MDGQKRKKLMDFLTNIDRRVVYLFMLLAVSLPFFLKPTVTLKTTKPVIGIYDIVEEAAKLRKPILISFDFDPSTMAELQPMAEALLRHAFSKDVKVVGITFMINGTNLAAQIIDGIAKEYDKKVGEDYVFLGWLPQFSLVILNFGDDFRKSYKADFRGKKIDEIPMLKNFQNFDDFHLVVCLTGTKMLESYIVWGVDRFNFNFAGGVTAVSAAEQYPFLQSGQLKGLMGGMKGAAEYEVLINKNANAMRGMASQTWGHLVIIFFIVIGNILYYFKKRMQQNADEQGGI
jgi:hypothetical protein